MRLFFFGLGKTYLLQQIQREVSVEGMLTVWIDFVGEHRHCGGDKFALLHEIHRQLTDSDDKNIFHENEENVFRIIGQHLAQRSRKLVLFFDNADRVSWRMLEWIRSTLLKRLSDFQQIGVVASGQHKIREWQGYAVSGQPFQKIPLSSFDETVVLRKIIQKILDSGSGDPQVPVDELTREVYYITRGHPLAIETVLQHIVDKGEILSIQSLHNRYQEICERCLSPIVYGGILASVPSDIQPAFSSLCIFRYVWQGLIETLTRRNVPDEIGGPWEPFSSRGNMVYWWHLLQNTYLIYQATPRQMFPISPVVRQLTVRVLQYEDESLYRARNRRARQEYQLLLGKDDTLPTQRAAWFIEVLYHTTQDGSLTDANAASELEHILVAFLNDPISSERWLATAPQLKEWLHEDTELREAIARLVNNAFYNHLLEVIEEYISRKQGD